MFLGIHYCKFCNRATGTCLSIGQQILFSFLLMLMLIPGIIYIACVNGKLCGLCKVRYDVTQEELDGFLPTK